MEERRDVKRGKENSQRTDDDDDESEEEEVEERAAVIRQNHVSQILNFFRFSAFWIH